MTKVTVHTPIVYLNLVGNKVRFANEVLMNLWLSFMNINENLHLIFVIDFKSL